MATSSGGATPFLDSLPPKLRLVIYEDVLRFKSPVMKISRNEKKADTTVGILFVNKQILEEAFPVLYKDNTISVFHHSLCGSRDSKILRPDCSSVTSIKIRLDPSPHDWWIYCSKCESVEMLVNTLTSDRFPRLKSTVICFNEDWTCRALARQHLQRQSMDLAFDGVGRFQIVGPPKGTAIRFIDEDVATAWDRFSAAPAQDIHADRVWPQLVREGIELDSEVGREIQRLFAACHDQTALIGETGGIRVEIFRNLLGRGLFENGDKETMEIHELITNELDSLTNWRQWDART